MTQIEQAPGTLAAYAGANDTDTRKCTQFHGHHQHRVFNFLMKGGKFSAADITAALHLSDPRSVIRDLRCAGIDVRDEWRPSVYGSRYKVYWIERPDHQPLKLKSK